MPNKPLLCVTCAATVVLSLPSAASAVFSHAVASGESLSSIAAADGLSVAQLAAANGLSSAAPLTAGATLMIPPQSAGSSPVAAATPTAVGSSVVASSAAASGTGSSGGGYVVQPGDTLSAIATRAGVPVAQLASANGLDANGILPAGRALHVSGAGSGTTAPVSTTAASGTGSSGGGYVVQPGDTLSAIATRSGLTVAQLAAANGLDAKGILPAGQALQVSGGGSGTTVPVSSTIATGSAAGQPVGVPAQGVASAPPYPTPERVSASEVGQIASANGVSPSLAAAIGWQESGFNNDLVSAADARGVMQILPGTWEWIQNTLTSGTPLAPASAASNVRGGVLLLHSLLSSTGGDPALAAAGYYQGLSSVQSRGMYSDTQAYVKSVMALRLRFGGTG
jgi:LysM repeat protein